MNVLALDPATRTGFACDSVRGVWTLSTTEPGAAADMLVRYIDNAHGFHGPFTLIVCEDAAFGSHNLLTQLFHAELRGAIKLAAYRLRVPFRAVNPSTIKVFATDNGHAKKPAMMAAYRKWFGFAASSEDECDARFLLELAKQCESGGWPKPAKKKPRQVRREKRIDKLPLFAKGGITK